MFARVSAEIDVQLAPVKRWHIGRQRDFAIATEAAAGLAGGKVKCDQPRIVRAEKNPVGTGRLRSDCRIVPYRDAAADGVISGCRSASRRSNTQSSRPLVASRAMTRSNGVQKTSFPATRTGVTSKELRAKITMPCRVTGMIGPGDP